MSKRIAVQTTSNYDRFVTIAGNREVNLKNPRHKVLIHSMKTYGWLDSMPMTVKKNGKDGKLIVVNGQHRLGIAKANKMPVKYVVEEQELDIAILNSSAKVWGLLDYVTRYAAEGLIHYENLLKFYEENSIPLSLCAILLGGGQQKSSKVHGGEWTIKTPSLARRVVKTAYALGNINKMYLKVGAMRALRACYLVEYFEPDRLVDGAAKMGNVHDITATTAFTELYEELYNFRKHNKKPLGFHATAAMKENSRPKTK